MSSKFQDIEKFRRPEMFLAELLNKSARGELWSKDEHVQTWYRAAVVAVDVEGGLLQNPSAEGYVIHKIDGKEIRVPAMKGPTNPRNSVKARIITGGFDQLVSDDDLVVFWPMLQEHDSIPIKPGEYVYVTFEDENFEHGLWFGKVSGHDNVNYYRGQDSFKTEDKSLAAKFDDSPKQQTPSADDSTATNRLITNNKAGLFEE